MQLIKITALLALATATSAGGIPRSPHGEMIERYYVGGPVAYARHLMALRHASTNTHHSVAPRAAVSRAEAWIAEMAEVDARGSVKEPVEEAIEQPAKRSVVAKRAPEPVPEAHPEAESELADRSASGTRVWGY